MMQKIANLHNARDTIQGHLAVIQRWKTEVGSYIKYTSWSMGYLRSTLGPWLVRFPPPTLVAILLNSSFRVWVGKESSVASVFWPFCSSRTEAQLSTSYPSMLARGKIKEVFSLGIPAPQNDDNVILVVKLFEGFRNAFCGKSRGG